MRKSNDNFDVNDFRALFEVITDAESNTYVSEVQAVEIKVKDFQGTISEIEEIGLDIEEHRENKIRIILSSIDGANCYWTDELFLQSSNSLDVFENNIAILNIDNGSPRTFLSKENVSSLAFGEPDDFFENCRAYWQLLDFLEREAKNGEEGVFHFVDFYSKDFRRFIFISPKTGKITIKHGKGISELALRRGFSKSVTRFVQCFSEQNRHLPKFLKTELLIFLKPIKMAERMDKLLISLDQIIDSAEINFEVYLNDLSIDNIRKDYDEYKHRYFEETSSVLGKLTNKIIALPIAISTTLFAITKVSDSTPGVILLIISITVATYYIGILLKLSIKDLGGIKESIQYDYQVLLQSPFFSKYPKELDKFEESKKVLGDRLELVTKLSINYFWILFFSNLVIIIFALSYWIDFFPGLIFIFCVGGFVIAILKPYFLDE